MRLFKYIVDQNNKNIKPYFVIDKNTPDYLKMKKIGKVIPFNSFKYKMYFLMADKIISSQADQWVLNAFGKNNNFYRDLYTFDYVFLQHGITKNDISGWLNYNDKNIKIFVTAANKEYESIINGNYGYSKNEVKLTGFPRYDTLISDANKTITIMPTWRKALQGRVNVTKGTRDYNFNFKNSEYFNFYNNLINDQRLINIMKKYNYKGIFVIHPSHKENYVDFKEIIEPLRLLFKDEVRALGTALGLDDKLVWRQPFPGPGLAIRIMGEVTREKLETLRDADYIFREEIANAGLNREIWQYFAVITNSKTVGVQGDFRTYENVIALRAVTSVDAMTADWARIPYEVLDKVSTRIVNEVKGVNRVVYDITSKPPATIEWE